MALIKTTAIVDEISGKLQGTVFAKNKGGAYVRGRGTVLNPNTQSQSAVRSIFGSISQSWRDLSIQEQKAWIAAAPQYPYQNRLGDTKTLTGKGLFQKLNGNLLNIEQPAITAPLAPRDSVGVVQVFSEMVVDIGVSPVISFDLRLASQTEETVYILEMTPSLSTGVTSPSNQYRKVAIASDPFSGDDGVLNYVSFETPLDTPYDNYVATFGQPQEGSKIYARVKGVNVNTGQATTYFSFSAIVINTVV